MFERFTENARQVLVAAQDESRALRHNYIGTEHLLLGLLRDEEGIATRVLHLFDLTVEDVRAEIRRVVGEGDEVVTGQIPFTPRAKRVLELSLREALSRGSNDIGTEHILLAIVAENEGVAARILLDFDIEAEMLGREVLLFDMRQGRSERAPRKPGRADGGLPSNQVLADTATPGVGVAPGGEASFGGRAPWWTPLVNRADLWLGMASGALLFGVGLLVGFLIWG
jgi:ATP-dependent Clp protease ATP-binding subunit ClpC